MEAEQDKLGLIQAEIKRKTINEKLKKKMVEREADTVAKKKEENEKKKQLEIEEAFLEEEQEAIKAEKAAAAHTRSLVNAMNSTKASGTGREIKDLLSNFQGFFYYFFF